MESVEETGVLCHFTNHRQHSVSVSRSPYYAASHIPFVYFETTFLLCNGREANSSVAEKDLSF